MLKDPNVYIKTNRASFTPKVNETYYSNSSGGYKTKLPESATKTFFGDIYSYLKKNAVNCEEAETKELLKELNDEVNNKGSHVLFIVKEGHITKLYYGCFSKFEDKINKIYNKDPSGYCGYSEIADYYIKYFNNRKSLTDFLTKNVIDKHIESVSYQYRFKDNNYGLHTQADYFAFDNRGYRKKYGELIANMEKIG